MVSTCGRIVLSLTRPAHVDWNWHISWEKYLKIDWSVKMPLYRFIMGVAGSKKWAPDFLITGQLRHSRANCMHFNGFLNDSLLFVKRTENTTDFQRILNLELVIAK